MPNKYIIGFDPYKRIKWYHKILKFFGKKIKTGSMTTFKWTDDTRTTIEVIKQEDTYL